MLKFCKYNYVIAFLQSLEKGLITEEHIRSNTYILNSNGICIFKLYIYESIFFHLTCPLLTLECFMLFVVYSQ